MANEGIVKMIVQKGAANVNLSMFSEEEKREILGEAAKHFIRMGKENEIIHILEYLDPVQYADKMLKKAESFMSLGEFETAAIIYEKLGMKDMADTIRSNKK
ncbi:hypothetical protein J4464_04220 [Candidatus Woesearchaeota archaeon]|nr:hypothetical protein [Candidatus Woesearchaeota archaeon]